MRGFDSLFIFALSVKCQCFIHIIRALSMNDFFLESEEDREPKED